MIELRPYQAGLVEAIRRSIQSGKRRPVAVAPCGAGKTILAASMLRSCEKMGKRGIVFAPRRELVDQFSEALYKFHTSHGVIMAGRGRQQGLHRSIQVASFDTLLSRAIHTKRMGVPPADLVISDEHHLSLADGRQQILRHYDNAIIVGLTATPARGDGRSLGETCDDLVETVTTRDLIDQGYLVPVRYFAPSKPDLDGLKISRQTGDYTDKSCRDRFNTPQMVGDILHNWRRLAINKKTVIFCIDRAHARNVHQRFLEAGFKAEYIDGNTPDDERRDIRQRMESGQTQIIVSILVMTYGVDIPCLECAVLARPTKSVTAYLQCIGRVLRTFPGKTHAVVIDHMGVVDEHGFAEDRQPWSLSAETTVQERRKQNREASGEPKEITCGECGTVFKSRRDCPNCGYEVISKGKPIPVYQADLQEVQKDQRKQNKAWSNEDKAVFYGGLKFEARCRSYSPGWAMHAYRAKFGVWPNAPTIKNAPEVPPTPEVLTFIKHIQIKYAKQQEKSRAA